MRNNILIAVIFFALGAVVAKKIMRPQIQTKIVTVTKEVEKIVHQTKIIIKKPDGTTIDTTTTDSETTSHTNKNEKDAYAHAKTSASFLIDVSRGANDLKYGLSLSREIIGPFTLGGWYLVNQNGGLSIGVNF